MKGSKPASIQSSKWAGVRAQTIEGDAVRALCEGRIAFIHVPGFLSPDRCRFIVDAFLNTKPPVYEERLYGIAQTIQLGIVMVPVSLEEYFKKAEGLNAALRSLYRGGEDPLLKLQKALASAVGGRIVEARENGRPYCTDAIIALPPGSLTPLHCDTNRDGTELCIARPPHQLSWNVYLAPAEKGGELILYRKRLGPDDEAKRLPGKWHYDPEMMRDVDRVVFRPQLGDLILLNSYSYHEVLPVEGSAHRITAHSFIVLDLDRGELTFWE